MLGWCERNQVDYVVGIARNPRLQRAGAELQQQVAEDFERTDAKQKRFGQFTYAAGKWKRSRRIIHKAEHTKLGANPRFVITNLSEAPEQVYAHYAYVLMDTIRRIGLKDTKLERATVHSIRGKLVKIACLIERKRSRWLFRLSAACPYQQAFTACAAKLRPT